MPKKINFTAIHVTGEDPKFTLSELDNHGPTVKGWKSAKYCDYPQEITLQLENSCTLSKIQILSHQFLIPSKVEIYCSNETEEETTDLESIIWDYLGYITLSDNERTEFKSRELKSANVPLVIANYIKLKLFDNHENSHNIYKQISLIAVNILGTAHTQPTNLTQTSTRHSSLTSSTPPPPIDTHSLLTAALAAADHYSPYDDLAFVMYVDVAVAQLIRELDARKVRAALAERFEYARRLKGAIGCLREAGERLGRYELEKRHAIEVEDYERATVKKRLIEELREETYVSLGVEQLLEADGLCPKNDELDIPDGASSIHTSVTSSLPVKSPSVSKRNSAVSSPLLCSRHQIMSPSSSGSPATGSPTNSNRGSFRRNRNKNAGKSTFEQYEEKPLPALRRSQTNEFLRECQMDLDGRICGGGGAGNTITTTVSKLTERERKQAALPILVYGADLVEKFYSKHYLDKEDGLAALREDLLDYDSVLQPHTANKMGRAAIFLLHRTLRDKVFSVYSLANEVIRLFFVQFVPGRVTPAEVARSVDKLLPELLTKSGDTSARIHHMAVHTILTMADCQTVRDLHVIPVHLSRIVSSSTHPRLALSRAEMVEQLIINQGISTDKQSGLTCRTLAEFGSSGLHHPAEAVRKVAERILVLVYRVNARLVRKQLPPDDDITRRNLLYRQLFQEFDKIDLQRKKEILEKTRSEDEQSSLTGSSGNSTTSGFKSAMNKCQSSSDIANKEFNGSGGGGGYPLQKSISGGHLQQNGGGDSDGDGGSMRRCMFCHVTETVILTSSPSMNSHYWRVCPVLHRCIECSQVIEVASLSHHLLNDCEHATQYFRCDSCLLAYKGNHDRCPGPVGGATGRCPLCQVVVALTDDCAEPTAAWKQHLTVECKRNARLYAKQVKIASPSHYQQM